jgi:hypothetical protein
MKPTDWKAEGLLLSASSAWRESSISESNKNIFPLRPLRLCGESFLKHTESSPPDGR